MRKRRILITMTNEKLYSLITDMLSGNDEWVYETCNKKVTVKFNKVYFPGIRIRLYNWLKRRYNSDSRREGDQD